jgi:hypothetical protein
MRPMTIALTLFSLITTVTASGDETKPVTLIPAENFNAFTGAIRKASGEKNPNQAFTLKAGILQCSREPGFVVTKQTFDRYRLVVEYRWMTDAPDRNSGVFVNTVGVSDGGAIGNVASLECDLLGSKAEGISGRVWLFGRGTKSLTVSGTQIVNGEVKPKEAKNLEKPQGEWNTLEIFNDQKALEVTLNGEITVIGSNPIPSSGKIMIQSGGIEYRRIEVFPVQ